jgi:hypothetical protein
MATALYWTKVPALPARPRGPEGGEQEQSAAGHAHPDQPAGIDVMAGEQDLGRDAAEGPQRGRGRGQAQPGDTAGGAVRASRVQPRNLPRWSGRGSL